VSFVLPESGLEIRDSRLRIQGPGLPVIELDARLLDDVAAERDRGGLGVVIGAVATVATGAASALVGRVTAALRPWTRGAPIGDPSGYIDAKRRLEAALAGRPPPEQALADGDNGEPSVPVPLAVGHERVLVVDDELRVGDRSFPIQVVRQLAQVGDNLPLGRHAALQAALALLVVAAHERRLAIEDPETLRARLTAYEGWSGQRAGR
jgi:hypothetical protein